MSDLRTEIFTKVLPKMKQLTDLNNLTFDDPEQPVTPVAAEPETLTQNERVFNWIKEHPATRSSEVAKALEGEIPKQSVVSQCYVMAERGILHKTICSSTGKFIYSTAVDTYPRVDKAAIFAKMKAGREALGKEEMVRRIQAGYNKKAKAPAAEPPKKKIVLVKKETPAPTPAVQVTPVDLNTLSIVQARKLYDELKQIFGA